MDEICLSHILIFISIYATLGFTKQDKADYDSPKSVVLSSAHKMQRIIWQKLSRPRVKTRTLFLPFSMQKNQNSPTFLSFSSPLFYINTLTKTSVHQHFPEFPSNFLLPKKCTPPVDYQPGPPRCPGP